MPLQTRLDNVVHRVTEFQTNSQGCKLVMNLRKVERVLRSIVPLCKKSTSYTTTHSANSCPGTHGLLWKNKDLPAPVQQGKSPASGTLVYLDVTNAVGLGPDMIYLKVGDYIDVKRLTKLIDLQKNTGANAIPIMVQVMCAYSFDLQREKEKDKREEQDGAQVEDDFDRFLPIAEELVTELKEGLINYMSVLPIKKRKNAARFPRLERMGWIHWNNATDEFMPYLSTWQKELIRRNRALCEKRVREVAAGAGDEKCVEELIDKHWTSMRKFHYDIIMSCSQQSTDEQTNIVYNRLTKGVYDAISMLEQINSFGGNVSIWFDCLVELLRESSIYTAKAVALLQLTLKHAIDGPTKGVQIRALYQVGDKKQRIADNTTAMFSGDCGDFDAVGVDKHVERTLSILVKVLDEKATDADAKRYVKGMSKKMRPGVGLIANEVIATFGQFINRGDEAQRDCLNYVFDRIKKGKNNHLKTILCHWEKSSGKS